MTNEEWSKLERVIRSAKTNGQRETARRYTEQLIGPRYKVMPDAEYRSILRWLSAVVLIGGAGAILIIALFAYLIF